MNILKIIKNSTSSNTNKINYKINNIKKYVNFKISGSKQENDSFCLVRIIGNDLWPLHSNEQSFNNLSFMIENESKFIKCRKIFILNRIFDQEKQNKLKRILEKSNTEYTTIPFKKSEYDGIGFDFEPFGGRQFFEAGKHLSYKENVQTMMKLAVCRPKILYAMNINGARNKAMEIGAEYGEWILPWDGNCTLSRSSFETVRDSCRSRPYLPIKVLPMIRQAQGEDPYAPSILVHQLQEPQLVLHNSLQEPFNEQYAYGSRSKTELLARIGLPGPWQSEKAHFFYPESGPEKGYKFEYEILDAYAIRLASGIDKLDRGGYQNTNRHSTRNDSIFRTLCLIEGKEYEEFLSFAGKASSEEQRQHSG